MNNEQNCVRSKYHVETDSYNKVSMVYRVGKNGDMSLMGMLLKNHPEFKEYCTCTSCGGEYYWKEFLNRANTKVYRQCQTCRDMAKMYMDTWRKKNKLGKYSIKEGDK